MLFTSNGYCDVTVDVTPVTKIHHTPVYLLSDTVKTIIPALEDCRSCPFGQFFHLSSHNWPI